MSQKHLIIFDWDGTLMDSVGRIVSSMQATAKALELPVPLATDVQHIIGLSLAPAIEQLFGGLAEPQLRQFIRRYSDEYVTFNQTPTPLFNGIEVMLDSLRKHHLLAVATGKARRGLNRVLAETSLHTHFVATRTADETAGKPDPLMLQQLINEAQTSAARTIMVGDSIYDMEMAKNAGVTAIGVSYGVHSHAQLLAAGASTVVDSPAALHHYLETVLPQSPEDLSHVS
ncbi:HAD-IA family hydrolase [Idiomarina tyrosinivorans]|nr:HAD-IA family hydrolase [Idiomarina tyrosinivorans]